MTGEARGVRLIELFWELFKISLGVVGGGYAMIAVADEVFARRKWTAEGELMELLPVFQMVPGLIATHLAVYVGRKLAGVWGAVVGVIAIALPAILVFAFVSVYYAALPLDAPWLKSAFVGLRAALTGIILTTIVRGWRKKLNDGFAYALFITVAVAVVLAHLSVAWVLVAAMVLGVASLSAGGGSGKFSVSVVPLFVFLKYGLLAFGGGFVLVPMYLEDFVGPLAPYLQLGEDEFANVMALSQMTPGPVGVNCATFFGLRLAGIGGAVIASVLLIVPGSLIIYFVVASLGRFRNSRWVQGVLRGARPASMALMAIALWTFARMTVFDAEGVWHPAGALLIVAITLLVMSRKLPIVRLIWLSALSGIILERWL